MPNPTVTGPIPSTQGSQGRPQTDSAFDLAPYGFVEEEYFLSGTAKTYGATPTTADYTTRMLVRRPADPKKFNGTVIVEWNNVTAQHDQSPDYFWSYPMVDPMGGLKVKRALASGHSQSRQPAAQLRHHGAGRRRCHRRVLHRRRWRADLPGRAPGPGRPRARAGLAALARDAERRTQLPALGGRRCDARRLLDVEPRQTTCPVGGGMFPKRYAVSAGLNRLDEWVRTGAPAPRVPRLEFDANGQVALDEHGKRQGRPAAAPDQRPCRDLRRRRLPDLRRHDPAAAPPRCRSYPTGRSSIPDRRVRSPLPTHLVPGPV